MLQLGPVVTSSREENDISKIVGFTNWAWWYTPVIPVLGRLMQENPEFEASRVT
jgi:hypothetical protein